jgi:phosphopantothenoylcysteine decarboxylase/phosphopantothenate--cysteine ligase
MAEPEDIVQFIKDHLKSGLPLHGKQVLITAGPTFEAIDPVRFIGNHSSGKMGCELALCAAALGAQVELVLGPSAMQITNSLVNVHRVTSGQEMYDKVHEYFKEVDVAIAAAAVADYKPANVAQEKIKKNDDSLNINLVKTKDILASMGAIKKKQFLVGFALETQNEQENALKKLKKKNLDAIVLNSLKDKGAGFKTKTNKITFIEKDGTILPYDLKTKSEVASDIFDRIMIHIL